MPFRCEYIFIPIFIIILCSLPDLFITYIYIYIYIHILINDIFFV